jgi:uncharacterized protein YjiS (DUF1127 family)
MVMRTISSAPAALQGITGQSWPRWLVATLKRWWVAYMTWRIEQAAIAQLWSMSNRQLKDIGLTCSEITGAVRGEPARYRAFGRYYCVALRGNAPGWMKLIPLDSGSSF